MPDGFAITSESENESESERERGEGGETLGLDGREIEQAKRAKSQRGGK
jgi:hypothetical protein